MLRCAAVLSLLSVVAGCATTPGATISVIGATPAQVALEYTRWYGGEYQQAVALAQRHCQAYGKNAQALTTQPAGPNPVDRVVTTFNCV